MAERQPPSWLQGGSHAAEHDRLVTKALLEVISSTTPSGVINDANLLTTANGTPNMSVNVAAGGCFVPATEVGALGTYHCFNDGAKNLSISAADATNPRRDLVVARVRDSQYSGAINAWALEVVQGIAAAVPADPVMPSSALVLARVAVAASASSITAANITDLRTFAGGWSAFTPVWQASGTAPVLNNGSLSGRYRRTGKMLDVQIRLTIGSTTTVGTGAWQFIVPSVIFRPGGLDQYGNVVIIQTAGMVMGVAQAITGTGGIVCFAQDSSPATVNLQSVQVGFPNAWVSGETLYLWGSFELA